MIQQTADSAVRILDFPDVLPKSAVAEFNFDDRSYDLVGPVIFCSCYRHTSFGTPLARKCLVTRRGALLLLRTDNKDDDASPPRSTPFTSSSSAQLPAIPNVSHFIEFANGGFLVEHHTTIQEQDMHFRITTTTTTSSSPLSSSDSLGVGGTPQRGGASSSSSSLDPVLLRFGVKDGSTLVKVLQHFSQFVPTLHVRSEYVPFPEFGASSPLAKLKGAFSSFRKDSSSTTKHLKGNGSSSSTTAQKPRSSSMASSNASTPTGAGGVRSAEGSQAPPLSPSTSRPKGLQHFPEDELVPIDTLKKRTPLPAEQISHIHQQLTNIYEFYAPDKAHCVPDLLIKYKGMEDLLLIKVVVKYGASNAIANGGTQQRATQFADEDENGTDHNVSSNQDRERHNFSLAVAAERLNLPPLRAYSSALRHRIDDVDLVDSDDLASVRLTEDSNDLTDADEVEDLMLEINVLERACDRMVWGAANAAANGQQQSAGADAYQQQQNIIQATRQRATTLAQCVTTICTSSQKQSHLDEEQHLEGQFLKQRQQQSGEAASRVARGSSTVEDIKNGGRTPITLGPRHPPMSAEDLKSIMDLL